MFEGGGAPNSPQKKPLVPTRWAQGINAALKSVMHNYGAMTKMVMAVAGARSGEVWEKCRGMWRTRRFVECMAGLIDITDVLKVREKGLQDREVSYVRQAELHDEVRTALAAPAAHGKALSHFRAVLLKNKDMVRYQGVELRDMGSAGQALAEVRLAFAKQLEKRFGNRPMLQHFVWLDLRAWPRNVAQVDPFLEPPLVALFSLWCPRLNQWNLSFSQLKGEMDVVTGLVLALPPDTDSVAFWKGIIRNRATFPALHFFLRMCLAVTPSNAQVESAFSKLRNILTNHRTLLDPRLVEQLLILSLDALPWDKYDFGPILTLLRTQGKRARFRLARADKGTARGARKRGRPPASQHNDCPDSSSGEESSACASPSSSSTD